MELKELRSLVALSKLGTIALAAEHLHLTPPAVHKQLKILVDELGAPLYEKVGRRLQLTQAAEVILPYLTDLLAQYDAALAALEEWKGMKRGRVRVGTGSASYVLPVLLKRFRRAHPGVELLLESGNAPVLLENLRAGILDLVLAVSADVSDAADISIEASWDYELVLVSHTQRFPRRLHLVELKHVPFILFRKGRFEESIEYYFAGHGFQPNVVMRFDNAEFIKSMVLAGMGVSVLSFWLVNKDVKEGHLKIIRQVEPPLYSRLSLARRKSAHVPLPVQAFIATARSTEARDLPLLKTSRPAHRTGGRESLQED